MRPIQKAIAALALMMITSGANSETAPDAPLRHPIGQLVELARQNMINAVDAANKRVGYCTDLGKANIVKPDEIAKLKLTSAEIKIALFYLHNKAKNACMSPAVNAATVEIIMFKVIELEAYGRNDPAPFTNSKFQYTAEDVCCGTPRIDLNAQLNYMGLSAGKRAALEAIPELKKPFNVFELSEYFHPTPVSAKP